MTTCKVDGDVTQGVRVVCGGAYDRSSVDCGGQMIRGPRVGLSEPAESIKENEATMRDNKLKKLRKLML